MARARRTADATGSTATATGRRLKYSRCIMINMDEDAGKQNRRLIKVYRFAIYATYVRLVTSAVLAFVASALLFALDPAKFMSVLKNDYISYLFAVNYTFYFMVMVYVIIGAVVFMVCHNHDAQPRAAVHHRPRRREDARTGQGTMN